MCTLFTSFPALGLPFEPDAVLLANGDYPVHAYPLYLLATAPYVACCDGAANAYMARGGVPDRIIGDGDSLLPELRERWADRLHRVTEQETNDLTKSLLFLEAQGRRRIVILGATGKREDHTLGNISLLVEHRARFDRLAMVTDHGFFLPACHTATFASLPGQQISLFNFGACHLRSEGLVYPIYDFRRWWEGTLNEASGWQFTIHADGEYLVYFDYSRKNTAGQACQR